MLAPNRLNHYLPRYFLSGPSRRAIAARAYRPGMFVGLHRPAVCISTSDARAARRTRPRTTFLVCCALLWAYSTSAETSGRRPARSRSITAARRGRRLCWLQSGTSAHELTGPATRHLATWRQELLHGHFWAPTPVAMNPRTRACVRWPVGWRTAENLQDRDREFRTGPVN